VKESGEWLIFPEKRDILYPRYILKTKEEYHGC
jgi:hypothetical protein